MADELLHVVEQASTPTVCLGALHAPEPKVLAANAIRHLWMLPPHRSARGLTAQFEIVQRGAQFEQGGALAAGQFEGGGDVAGAGVEVHYRLDRTLAPREGFVNDSLITTLPAIRNRIRELRRHAARSLAESSTRQAFANAKVEIEGLAAQLDKGQALDLRWTIIDLFVSGCWYLAQLLDVIHRHHPHCG